MLSALFTLMETLPVQLIVAATQLLALPLVMFASVSHKYKHESKKGGSTDGLQPRPTHGLCTVCCMCHEGVPGCGAAAELDVTVRRH